MASPLAGDPLDRDGNATPCVDSAWVTIHSLTPILWVSVVRCDRFAAGLQLAAQLGMPELAGVLLGASGAAVIKDRPARHSRICQLSAADARARDAHRRMSPADRL